MGRGAEEYNISFSSLDFPCSSFFQEIQVHGNSGHKFSIDTEDVLHFLYYEVYENLRLFWVLNRAPEKTRLSQAFFLANTMKHYVVNVQKYIYSSLSNLGFFLPTIPRESLK